MLLAFDPFVLRVFSDFGVRWYGLIYWLCLGSSFLLLRWIAPRQNLGLTSEMVFNFLMSMTLGSLIGGRLGYCLLYDPTLLWKFREALPFWGLLALNEGGLSIYGAMIGAWIAAALYSWKYRLSLPYLLDLTSLVGALQIIWMRLGNFLNGEILGRECTESPQYCFRFPQEVLTWPTNHPEKLLKLGSVMQAGQLFSDQEWQSLIQGLDMNSASLRLEKLEDLIEKLVLEVQQGNLALRESLAPLLTLRFPVQLAGAALEGVLVFLILFIMWHRPRRSGVITGLFLTVYSLTRFFLEFYREPDLQVGYLFYSVTLGQILSVIFFLLGFWYLSFYGRRDAVVKPGWGLGSHVRLHRR